ncbi:MAG: 50S ribosomal protein L22 [Parcubacteria group bacterium GW2011_GWD2_42_14]|nr:MAG: 50S ribosomal protein L22 [Parcubacteria group bacterium GW2011_GWD2_42_14]
MQAFLKNNRQAPRKVRLIARAVVGKTVAVALSELTYMPHKGAKTLSKLIVNAVANAKQADSSLNENTLMVKNITVDKGVTLMRFMPRAFGRASPIHKESSHIRVLLAEVPDTKVVKTSVKAPTSTKATAEKEVKKPTAKASPIAEEAMTDKPTGKEFKEEKETKEAKTEDAVTVEKESISAKATADKEVEIVAK